MDLSNSLIQFIETTGFANLTWGNVLMIGVACVLLFLAIKKGFEPLLLVPIGFGMLLANIPISGITAPPVMELGPDGLPVVKEVGGLLYYIFQGDVLGIFPPLIFLGIGAMTDFGP